MQGKLIVLEGTDGSGKSTQFAALCRHLERETIPYRHVVFPRYKEPSA
ncbi:MAG: thymidylate kinase, partial [Clostridiales bacterium]|nr:thymidylate kinase [Clostridiales bacterium]